MKHIKFSIIYLFICNWGFSQINGDTNDSKINFENRAIERGIDFSCGTTILGNGVSFFDFDNDGWDDISFTTDDTQPPKFYKNVNGTFVELDLNISEINYQTKQINWVDFDNDGDNDLFLTSDINGNKLYENKGDLILRDVTASSGLPIADMNTFGASWGDYNNDGFLDVFLSNRDPSLSTVTPNYLFKNNGDKTFTDVSESAGIDRSRHLSFCSAFFDFNNDGWQDIYVSNDKTFTENLLYKNNGNGTFTEIGALSNTNVAIEAMTVTIGDYNNDGWQDIYVTNGPDGNVLLKNNGDETFTDMALASGTIFNSIGWGAIFLDADNDMDIDLYVSGSSVNTERLISAAFYENGSNGINGQFEIPNEAGFTNDIGNSYSNAIGDINNDGFLDFVVTNSSDQNIFLWENTSNAINNWLKINLEGTVSNKAGIGSRIKISINGQNQYRYTHCGEGYLSQNSGTEFFGLGNGSLVIDSIEITWLSGTIDTFTDVPVNQTLNIVEGSSKTLSTNDFDINNIILSPNPANDILKITSKHSIIKTINIYNSIGQLISSINSNRLEKNININTYISGVYYISITTENGNTTKRFIKL